MRRLPREGFFVCVTARNEARYIREWVAHHLAIGFDHIFVFDNDSTDDLKRALKGIGRKHLTYIWWPRNDDGRARQQEAYVRLHQQLRTPRPGSWVLFIDVDEFLVLKRHGSIREFIQELGSVDAVSFNWRLFGDSGQKRFEPGLVTERFTRASLSTFPPNGYLKTMARCSMIVEPDIHWHQLVEDARIVDPDGKPLPLDYGPAGPRITHTTAQLNHYFTKSVEEWRLRRSIGRADKKWGAANSHRPESAFAAYNKNDVEDRDIVRHRKQLRAILSRFDRRYASWLK